MIRLILPIVLACVSATAAGVRAPALPQSDELRRWFSLVKEVERGLERGDPHFGFQMKKMHVHAKVLRDKTVIGAFRSETSSTCVDAEIAAFNIARVLGCGELFQPAAPIQLRGKGLATLKQLMTDAHFPEPKEDDRQKVLQEIADNPNGLRGDFRMATPPDAMKYHAIELPKLPPNGVLNEQDRVAVFLKSGSPQPGTSKLKLKGLDCRAPAAGLARELSDILLVDALTGQWDRFSGGNLHVVIRDGCAHFLAVDNGGGSFTDDQGYLRKFKKWVSRFDRTAVLQLFAMEEFFDSQKKGVPAAKRRTFLGFSDERALAAAMEMHSASDWETLKKRVHEVASHIRSAGEGKFFAE